MGKFDESEAKELLEEKLGEASQQGGDKAQNIFMLGALLFASTGQCDCKACRLLKGMAQSSVDSLVDGLLAASEAEQP